MELDCKDDVSREWAHEHEPEIVARVHTHLGLASVARVRHVSVFDEFRIDTARGAINVNRNVQVTYSQCDLLPR